MTEEYRVHWVRVGVVLSSLARHSETNGIFHHQPPAMKDENVRSTS